MNDLFLQMTAGISILLNIVFLIFILKSKKQKKKTSDSRELQEFMLDLMHGEGLVKVTRINTSDVFLRSPREYR